MLVLFPPLLLQAGLGKVRKNILMILCHTEQAGRVLWHLGFEGMKIIVLLLYDKK